MTIRYEEVFIVHQNDYKLAKILLGLFGSLAAELFREIQSGKAEIVIKNGYLSFERDSRNFPITFKVRIPTEQETASYIQKWLESL